MARRYAFARRERLLQAAEFRAVFASPFQAREAQFILRAVHRGGDASARLGLVVPRRAVPKAWQRNHLKRLIRESFRHHKATLHGLDVVVQVTSKALTADARARRQTLERLWMQIAEQCRSSSSH